MGIVKIMLDKVPHFKTPCCCQPAILNDGARPETLDRRHFDTGDLTLSTSEVSCLDAKEALNEDDRKEMKSQNLSELLKRFA